MDIEVALRERDKASVNSLRALMFKSRLAAGAHVTTSDVFAECFSRWHSGCFAWNERSVSNDAMRWKSGGQLPAYVKAFIH